MNWELWKWNRGGKVNNCLTKFYEGQKVRITEGFYQGMTGVVKDYTSNLTLGLIQDCEKRKMPIQSGFYNVQIGFLKTAYVLERSLESVK